MNAPLGFTSYLVRTPRMVTVREDPPLSYEAAGEADSDADPDDVGAWTIVHRRLLALGRRRAAIEHALCRWLLAAERLDVANKLGMASLFEYADRHLGLTHRQTEERLRVGRALPGLAALDEALATGALSFSKVREVSRIATAETEQAWVDWSANHGAREVEKAVATRQRGERPTDAGDPSRLKHRLRFEVKAETMALFRDLQARIASDLGGDVDDDTLLLEIARRALGQSDADDGRAPYQVAITRCDTCRQASIDAGGQRHVVDEAVAAMIECDAQQVGLVDEGVDEGADCPHVGAPTPERATQTIPPATRRKVLRRDGKRCVVPGCTNHRFLDIHHVRPRSEGGTHDPELLATLCGAHHRATHDGTLVIEGTAPAGFSFRHADGTPYGARSVAPEATDVATQVFRGLTNLGFKQTEARARITKVQQQGTPGDIATFLRHALQLA